MTHECGAGELAGSSSSSFLGTDEAQASSSSDSGMDLAVASFPLSFLMSNCSALQGLNEQVCHMVAHLGRLSALLDYVTQWSCLYKSVDTH